MEDEKKDFSKLLSMPRYVYQVSEQGRATMVRISAEDSILVSSYREVHKKPLTTIIHLMIGQATKCWEEKHDEKVRELEELRIKLLAAEHIMALYRKKYGPLHVKKDVRNSIIKPQEDSLNKPG